MPADLDAAHVEAAKSGVAALLANVRAEANAEGLPWTPCLDNPALRLRVFYSSVPGSSILRFRATCDIAGHSPQFVQATISDNAARLGWDSNIAALDTTVLRGEGAAAGAPPAERGMVRVVLLRSATRPVGPISAREFLDVTGICNDEFPGVPKGSVVSGGAGVVDAARYPEAAGFVRGWNSPGCGWLFEKTDEGTRVHYVIHSDLKGWMLAMIVNNALTQVARATGDRTTLTLPSYPRSPVCRAQLSPRSSQGKFCYFLHRR
jgi:hypothetical protein